MKRILMGCVILLFAASSLVRAAVISGVVKDFISGEPLPNIYIALRSTATLVRDTTDETGAYSISYDSVGEYTLRAIDLKGAYSQTSVSVKIEDAAVNQTIDILMKKTPKASVSGTITDSAASTPIAGAVVSLIAGISMLSDTTDSAGVFKVDVPYGSYRITAAARGYNSKSDSVIVADSTPKTINIQLSRLVYSSIKGKVTDSANGEALFNVKIVLYGMAGMMRTRIDSTVSAEDGSYSLDSAFTGTYVRASPAGYTRKAVDIIVTSENTQKIDLALSKNAIGIVYDERPLNRKDFAPSVSVMKNGNIRLINGGNVRAIFLYNVNGRLIGKNAFDENSIPSVISIGKPLSGGRYVLILKEKGSILKHSVFIP